MSAETGELFMRKRIIKEALEAGPQPETWLDLGHRATVEVTSETDDQPIEAALVPGRGSGWRASEPGKQLIRILFDQPLPLKRIHLVFEEDEQTRTQEFTLRWSQDRGQSYKEVLRQQYNFAPWHQTANRGLRCCPLGRDGARTWNCPGHQRR